MNLIQELKQIVINLNERKSHFMNCNHYDTAEYPENYLKGQVESYEQAIDLIENLLQKIDNGNMQKL